MCIRDSVARLQYPSVQLEAGSCLHVDYELAGHVQLEVGYQLDGQSDGGHLLCTLVPNSTHVGSWFSADIPLPAGRYRLYFNAVLLSLLQRPTISLDSIKLLNENCTRIIFTGKCSLVADAWVGRQSVCVRTVKEKRLELSNSNFVHTQYTRQSHNVC